MMEEKQSWITEVYQEFWSKADELAKTEYPDAMSTVHTTRRDRHLDAMVAMFLALMAAPEAPDDEDEDCEGEENEDCDECDHLPECRQRWSREARKN